MAGKQLYINKEDRQFIADMCELEISNITSEIAIFRTDLHFAVFDAKVVRDKEPKRSDFSDLLPHPVTDFQYAHSEWKYKMDRPMQIVGYIRELQARRQKIYELEAKL